jgi:glc operon protein GlcG
MSWLRRRLLPQLVSALQTARRPSSNLRPAEYGISITIAQVKQAAAAADAEVARVGSLPDCIAIVDTGGNLVYFERMDNAQTGSVQVALDKATTAVLFRRPSKAFADAVAAGRTAILGLHNATPLEGGLPIIVGGKIIGGIGASGGIGEQDGKVAAAGLAAIAQ